MTVQKRMSPFTALFLGIFGVAAVGIAAGSSIALFAMNILNTRAGGLLTFVGDTVDGLPTLFESLPPALGDLLNDRRAPDYASNVRISVDFVGSDQRSTLRPALTITNIGDEVISLLAVRVAALDAQGVPFREWTEVAATPLAIENEWRGPLLPHNTRHVVMSSGCCHRKPGVDHVGDVTAAVEIVDIRIWHGEGQSARTASLSD